MIIADFPFSVVISEKTQDGIEEAIQWCCENCRGTFKQSWTNDYLMLFELNDDAVMFRLSQP